MNLINSVWGFLLALGPLIIFHELGHYLVARLCGVKVLRFSLGMGKVVWSRRFGRDQTEWVVSMLPLGGYVKMLDARDPDAGPIAAGDLQREFTRQSVWRRIAIVAAGPLANFLLAIAIFTGLSLVGTPEPEARLRQVGEHTTAYQAGLRGGERITAVNGKPVAGWSGLRWELVEAIVDKREARLDVAQPNGGSFAAVLPASALAGLDIDSDVLGKLGLDLARPPARALDVPPGGPAARAGLQAGDVVTAIDGKPVIDAIALIEAVQGSGGRALALSVQRGGVPLALTVTPEQDPKSKAWLIQVRPDAMPKMVTVSYGPVESLQMAAARTWDTSVMTLKMIWKMISGEVSWKNVTGPITIADVAGKTVVQGAPVFLAFIAFVSISLGVMNLLPIPVLDGGLLLYYSLEVLTGRPLPERIGAYAQRAGVGLLVLLMALAVFNDVARLL